MNDVVTVSVKQAQIIEGIVVVVLVVMMHFYHVFCREAQSTVCATATLSFEQSRDPSWFARVTSQQGLTATCKDPLTGGIPRGRGGFRIGGRVRSSKEGRVMPFQVEGTPPSKR